jgi:heme/copper-type cytochrome/quinol oxidase subunit 2
MLNIIFAIFQLLIAVGLIGFWVMFYFTEYKNRKMSEVEFKHEMSFTLPDLGWVLPNLIIAAIGVLLEEWFGYFFTITAASGMMFLGLIDLAFNLQNKKFDIKKYGFDAYMSIFIVAIMLIFGPIFLIYGGFNLVTGYLNFLAL